MIPVNQSERRIRNGEYGRGAEEMALTESSMLRARRRERVRTARWIRMVMVEASFMKCGSQASSMEEILLLLLHRNRSPFL